jgi:membrane protein implicated in regulation of membrane protease activity
MNYNIIIWLILFTFFVIFELSSPGFFFFLSLGFGSIGSAMAASFEINLIGQLITFVMVSIGSLFILYYYFKNTFKEQTHKTNVYALVGKTGVVIENIEPYKKGTLKINGELWFARSLDNNLIKAGEVVEVVNLQGSHVIVKPTNNITNK